MTWEHTKWSPLYSTWHVQHNITSWEGSHPSVHLDRPNVKSLQQILTKFDKEEDSDDLCSNSSSVSDQCRLIAQNLGSNCLQLKTTITDDSNYLFRNSKLNFNHNHVPPRDRYCINSSYNFTTGADPQLSDGGNSQTWVWDWLSSPEIMFNNYNNQSHDMIHEYKVRSIKKHLTSHNIANPTCTRWVLYFYKLRSREAKEVLFFRKVRKFHCFTGKCQQLLTAINANNIRLSYWCYWFWNIN